MFKGEVRPTAERGSPITASYVSHPPQTGLLGSQDVLPCMVSVEDRIAGLDLNQGRRSAGATLSLQTAYGLQRHRQAWCDTL
jgi:hypothetical protein